MRRMLGAAITIGLLFLLPSVAHAGAPQIPNVATSTNWLPFQTPGYSGPWDNPFGITLVTQPNPYSWIYQPGISSLPIFNLPICPGDVITEFILNYCGGAIGAPAPGNGQSYPSFPSSFSGPGSFGGSSTTLSGTQSTLPPTVLPPTTPAPPATISGSITLTAGSFVCWTGSVGGVIGGSSMNNSVSGCGNASYPFTLRSGDILSAVFQNSGPTGTLVLTVNCGGTPASSTTSASFGVVSDSCSAA